MDKLIDRDSTKSIIKIENNMKVTEKDLESNSLKLYTKQEDEQIELKISGLSCETLQAIIDQFEMKKTYLNQ